MANCSLLITCLPDGTFHVKETEPAGDQDPNPPIDQSVQSPDDVTALVQQWLQSEAQDAEGGEGDDASAPDMSGGDTGAMPAPSKAAWDQEAKSRDASGFRK